MLADEMRHVGGVVFGLVSTSVDRSVDKDFDIVGNGLVHHSFTLLRLAVLCCPILDSLLDAENAPDGCTS